VTGEVAQPAKVSGYANFRSTVDYVHEGQGQDDGLEDPVVLMDGAVRIGNVVFETDASYDASRTNHAFVRERSRFVYDDLDRTVRWGLGDLRVETRGFQGGFEVGGLSIERLYSDLQPQRNVRPRGERGFTLQRAATVETIINGRTAQRVRLDPGSYDVRDFPFVDGSNDVKIVIDDGSGVQESLNFSLFFDRDLLANGLSEFGIYAGVQSDLIGDIIEYGDGAAFSAFYRRGFSENLTAGINAQGLGGAQLIGAEALWGSPIGSVGADVAYSRNDDAGQSGYAFNVGLQRFFQGASADSQTLSVALNYRSRNFASVGETTTTNRFSWEGVASYSRNFGDRYFAGLDARYAIGRDAQEDLASLRASLGYRLSELTNLAVDLQQDFGEDDDETSVHVGLTRRFGTRSSGRLDYDSRSEAIRAGFQASDGRGIGARSLDVDLERVEDSVGLNGSVAYTANRAELGLAHSTSYGLDASRVTDQRTTARAAASISFADGHVAVGRPIFDSFVMVRPHKTLGEASVAVDPSPDGDLARSDRLGPAVLSELGSYSLRTVTYDVPGAPAGYDIGAGSVRVLPPYRSGYSVEVGSDYFVLAIGRLLDAEGKPLALLAGKAYEEGSNHPPISLFTSRDGRVSVQGLREGRWRIEMQGDAKPTYELVVPPDAGTLLRVGDLRPVSGAVEP
jgi:outer membrane usher protein